MDDLTRRALWNAASLAAGLEPDQSIDRTAVIDALRRPLPDVFPSDAEIFHAYRYYILRGGIPNAEAVVTYGQAAELAETTVEAVRQAAYRGQLVKLGTYFNGRERSGVTLRSLAEWRQWTLAEFNAAARRVEQDHA